MKPVFAATVVMWSVAAWAQGAIEVEVSPEVAALIRHQVASARSVNPKAFEAVQAARRQMPSLDARRRGRFAAVTPRLNAVPHATWALVDALVNDGALLGPASSQVAWQSALLESLGARREPSVEPVLAAAVWSVTPPEVARSAAEALGRLGTDSAVTSLVAAANEATTPARKNALFAGMGACRRVAMADFLSRRLAVSTVESEQLALVKALSVVANSWALETPAGAPVKAEIPQLRAIAARALVTAYVRSSGRVRQDAADAVLVVNAPETRVLLAQARVHDPAAVDALVTRLGAQAP